MLAVIWLYSEPSSTPIAFDWLIKKKKKKYLLLSPVFCFTIYVLEQLQILMNARKISMTVNKVLAKRKRKKCANYLDLTLLT